MSPSPSYHNNKRGWLTSDKATRIVVDQEKEWISWLIHARLTSAGPDPAAITHQWWATHRKRKTQLTKFAMWSGNPDPGAYEHFGTRLSFEYKISWKRKKTVWECIMGGELNQRQTSLFLMRTGSERNSFHLTSCPHSLPAVCECVSASGYFLE